MPLAARRLTEIEARVIDQTAELVDTLDAELGSLRRQRDSLNERIMSLARKRLLYLSRIEGSRSPKADTAERPPKPLAVRQVLGEVAPETLRLRDIHSELVRRGWSSESKRDRHALEVAVRALEQRGEIARPKRGFYRLRVDSEGLALTAAA